MWDDGGDHEGSEEEDGEGGQNQPHVAPGHPPRLARLVQRDPGRHAVRLAVTRLLPGAAVEPPGAAQRGLVHPACLLQLTTVAARLEAAPTPLTAQHTQTTNQQI